MRKENTGPFTFFFLFTRFVIWPHYGGAANGHDQKPVLLPADGNRLLKGTQILTFEDHTNKISFSEVKRINFRSIGSSIPNFNYSSSTIWLKIIIENQASSGSWGIVIENPNLLEAELFLINETGLENKKSTRRDRSFVDYYFPIKRGRQVIFLKIRSNESLHLPVKVIEANHLLESRHKMDLRWGVYYGMMLSIIFFNAFMFLSMRDIAYLYYVLYTALMCLLVSHITGYLGYFANLSGANLGLLDEYAMLDSLATIFGLLFTLRFLQIGRLSVSTGIVKYLLIGFCSILILDFLGQKLEANILAASLTFFSALCIIVIAVRSVLIEKYKPAYFFLLAWSFFLLGVMIFILTDFGILPYNIYTYHSPSFGNAIESVLMSLALGSRISELKKEIARSRQIEKQFTLKYQETIRNQNTLLKEAIHTRSIELKKASQIKDRFFSIVAHDLRNPLNSIASMLNLFQHEGAVNFTREQLRVMAQKLAASVRNMIDLTENLLTWARSEMEDDQLVAEEIILRDVVQECIKDLSVMSHPKNISISNDTEESVVVVADRQHLIFVIRNILSNAIKFTYPSGRVSIRSIRSDGDIKIQIVDTGIGMTRELITSIFHPDMKKQMQGTQGEKGTGLGLFLCKEFVEKNHGSISVKSELGIGSSFTISLPGITHKTYSEEDKKGPKSLNHVAIK